MNLESGRESCLACDITFKTVTHSLLLLLFVICPILAVELSQAQLMTYVVKPQQRLSKEELSQEDKAKKERKYLKQQKEKSCVQQEDLPLSDLALTRNDIARADISLMQENKDAGEVLNECQTVENYCHRVISEFKSKCGIDLCEKIVSFFCHGPLADSKSMYEPLAKMAINTEFICVGHHKFSHLVLQEQIFPLLWFLTNQENAPYPANCDSFNTRELLVELKKLLVSGENNIYTQEVVNRMRQSGKAFPHLLLSLHLSEADRVLTSKRLLDGEGDLALLHKAVRTKEHGWRGRCIL